MHLLLISFLCSFWGIVGRTIFEVARRAGRDIEHSWREVFNQWCMDTLKQAAHVLCCIIVSRHFIFICKICVMLHLWPVLAAVSMPYLTLRYANLEKKRKRKKKSNEYQCQIVCKIWRKYKVKKKIIHLLMMIYHFDARWKDDDVTDTRDERRFCCN